MEDPYKELQAIYLKWHDGKRPLSGYINEVIDYMKQVHADIAYEHLKETLMVDKLFELAKATNCNFHLEYNPHKSMYESAEKYITEMGNGDGFYDEVGEVDYNKDIWTLQVYPRTPIGFIAAVSNNPYELIYWGIEGATEY